MSTSLILRKAIKCPHCWSEFQPARTKWVAVDPGLTGDTRLGNRQQRFLPARFDVSGNAIDVHGGICREIACPHCHLTIPRPLLELPPLVLSILGAPGSGKSFLLACMIWQLRKILRAQFLISFTDADPEANLMLTEYEKTLFLSPDPERPATLQKTQQDGHLYQSVSYGDHDKWYPRPFVFCLHPEAKHPLSRVGRKSARALCLYDNAGEHFLPGGESPTSRATQHLKLSEALLFLFDPTQHPRFRSACEKTSDDPQIREKMWSHPQHQVVAEAAKRIRESAGLSSGQKLDRPVIVVLTKHDAWKSLTSDMEIDSSYLVQPIRGGGAGLYMEGVERLSSMVRDVVWEHAPEIVNAAESLSDRVYFIPVSLFRRPPETSSDGQRSLLIRPSDIVPCGVEIPMLIALNQTVPGLIPTLSRKL